MSVHSSKGRFRASRTVRTVASATSGTSTRRGSKSTIITNPLTGFVHLGTRRCAQLDQIRHKADDNGFRERDRHPAVVGHRLGKVEAVRRLESRETLSANTAQGSDAALGEEIAGCCVEAVTARLLRRCFARLDPSCLIRPLAHVDGVPQAGLGSPLHKTDLATSRGLSTWLLSCAAAGG